MGRTDLVRMDFGSRFVAARSCRVAAVAVSLCTVVWLAMSSSSPAQVVIFDGFGDADRDNDGVTDFGSVQDAGDVGIPWFRVNPRFVFGNEPNPKFLVVDDSVHPVNNPNGIGTGNALAIDQTPQSSADWAGFFGQTITLGPNVGDKLVVSFDHRNLDLGNPDSLAGSQFTTLRFGLWQDSDNQLGTETIDGDGVTATWGEDDGHFDNCATSSIGTCGDYGIWGRVQSGAVPSEEGPFPPPLDVDDFSIAEEINEQISMGGNDFETMALPADAPIMGDYNGDGNVGAADYALWRSDPDSFGGDPDGYDTWLANFGAPHGNALFTEIPIVLLSPHTLSLTLERVTPDATGQDIRVEVAVDGIAFGAQDPNDDDGDPDTADIVTRDSFDYFMFTHNTPMDFYMIDNFKVELIAAPGSGSTPVPEPASLQLAILLLLSALLACRRCH